MVRIGVDISGVIYIYINSVFFFFICFVIYIYIFYVSSDLAEERIIYLQGFSLWEIERLCVKSFVCFWLLILVSLIWGKYVSVIILVALIWNWSYFFVSWLLYLDQICLNYPQDFSKYFFPSIYTKYFLFSRHLRHIEVSFPTKFGL